MHAAIIVTIAAIKNRMNAICGGSSEERVR